MFTPTAHRLLRAFLYGAGSLLLLIDLYYLSDAVFARNFVPILPIFVSILAASGLLLIILAEQRAKQEDIRDHRRISRVAHQLTAPLRHLQEELQQLRTHADHLPAEDRLLIKRMETRATVVLENVRDVFLMLQAAEGPIAQQVRQYDLCTLLAEAIERARPLAAARNVELVYQVHCQHAPVRLDRRLFFIVVAHLLENAMTYTVRPGLVNVGLMRGQKIIRVIVQDRGLGIRPEDIHLVERPFARGAEAARIDPDGIGVGIALSKLIVQEMNGRLVWKNRRDHAGAQFEIHLPLVTDKRTSRRPPATARLAQPGSPPTPSPSA